MFLVTDDIDGQPIKEERSPSSNDSKPKFVASKWETVDDRVVKAQGTSLFLISYRFSKIS